MLHEIDHILPKAPAFSYNTGVIYKEEDHSFLADAITMCQENNIFFKQLSLKVVKEDTVINELFDGSSVLAIIRAIIDIFISNIKELVERFCHVVGTFVSNEHHIEKYAQQILKFDGVLKIEDFRHYKYTNLEEDIPPICINSEILDDYGEVLDKLSKIGRETDRKELMKKLTSFSIKSKSEFRDKDIFLFRGKVVGKKEGISKELYSEELHKVFRNGKTAPHLGDFHQEDIHESYRRWKNEKIFTKDIKRQRTVLEANANEVKKKIQNIDLSSITNGNFKEDYELENILNGILRNECDKIQEICNITLLAFGAKLEALKEAIIQDKKVLYYTISQIIGS